MIRNSLNLNHLRSFDRVELICDSQQSKKKSPTLKYLGCNFKNLQPLWAKDNLKKSSKFDG